MVVVKMGDQDGIEILRIGRRGLLPLAAQRADAPTQDRVGDQPDAPELEEGGPMPDIGDSIGHD
jgi:hypothetical protein